MTDGYQNWPVCPYCRQTAGDQYETGSTEIREFECDNPNCRCQVFKQEGET